MKLRLVKLGEAYRAQLVEMMEEWTRSGEKIIPYAIRKNDYHDFQTYLKHLDTKKRTKKVVPDTTFFCLDEERNLFVGAVNIRPVLNKRLLLDGGHIGYGVRPSERRKGVAASMLALALEELRRLGAKDALLVCDRENIASAKTIRKNGGNMENQLEVDGKIVQRYWIHL